MNKYKIYKKIKIIFRNLLTIKIIKSKIQKKNNLNYKNILYLIQLKTKIYFAIS